MAPRPSRAARRHRCAATVVVITLLVGCTPEPDDGRSGDRDRDRQQPWDGDAADRPDGT